MRFNDPYIFVALGIFGIVVWKASRVYHQARAAWKAWRDAVASIPVLRRLAFGALKAAFWTMVVLALWYLGLTWIGQYR